MESAPALTSYFAGSFKPTEKEQLYVSYILRRIEELGVELSDLAVQKVVVDVIEQLELPVLTFWYLHGKTGMFPNQRIAETSDDIFNFGEDFIDRARLDGQIEASTKIFGHLGFNQVKKKQYEEYGNTTYLAFLKLDELMLRGLDDDSDRLISVLSDIRANLPAEEDYGPVYAVLFKLIKTVKRLGIRGQSINNSQMHSSIRTIVDVIMNINPLYFNNGVDAQRLRQCIFPDSEHLRLYEVESNLEDLMVSDNASALTSLKVDAGLFSDFSDLLVS